jgi:hypothetical protein
MVVATMTVKVATMSDTRDPSSTRLKRPGRAGHHQTDALHRKSAIHRQTKEPIRRPRRQRRRQLLEGVQEIIEAGTCARRGAHTGCCFEKRPRENIVQFGFDDVGGLAVDQIALGEDDEAGLQSQQLHDVQMLARLWHHRFVGGNNEHTEVDTGGAGNPGLDEALMSGHVHQTNAIAARQLEIRKSKLNGDAARLLLAQTIRVDAGECLDQFCLAMIDMAGGSNDEMTVSGHARSIHILQSLARFRQGSCASSVS